MIAHPSSSWRSGQYHVTVVSLINKYQHPIIIDMSKDICGPGKLGLKQFGTMMVNIWNAAKKDDPYAEWYLLKTYQIINEAKEKLKNAEMILSDYFKSIRGIEVTTYFNESPKNYSLRFATPFGYMATFLVVDLDLLVRQILTLQKIGIPILNDNITIKILIQTIQEVFALPKKWRTTGVTRQDIIDKNTKAQKAIELLGEVPESILNKKISFSFLPKMDVKVIKL